MAHWKWKQKSSNLRSKEQIEAWEEMERKRESRNGAEERMPLAMSPFPTGCCALILASSSDTEKKSVL